MHSFSILASEGLTGRGGSTNLAGATSLLSLSGTRACGVTDLTRIEGLTIEGTGMYWIGTDMGIDVLRGACADRTVERLGGSMLSLVNCGTSSGRVTSSDLTRVEGLTIGGSCVGTGLYRNCAGMGADGLGGACTGRTAEGLGGSGLRAGLICSATGSLTTLLGLSRILTSTELVRTSSSIHNGTLLSMLIMTTVSSPLPTL